MRRYIKISFAVFIILFCTAIIHSEIKVKIRDISYISGLKENQILGFGLVVGLQGSGDSKSMITRSSIRNLLKNLGLEYGGESKSKNIASVLITAKLPPFARVGDRLDITVSSIGDAKSLKGGILVQSPLRGADNRIYLVAQGPVSIGHSGKSGKSVKTVAYITNGGIVEREIVPEFVIKNRISLVLKNWDFTVANQMLKAVVEKYPESKPQIINGGMIILNIPGGITPTEFISGIENIEISPSSRARVVINEKDGTIVMGGDIRISEVMVSKDGITVKVKGSSDTSNTAHFKETSTVKDLVDTLNYIGVPTSDMISIIKALKDAGALHAELIIR